MSAPSTPPVQLSIAFAASTPIYAPVYLAIADTNSQIPGAIKIIPNEFGDRDALRQVLPTVNKDEDGKAIFDEKTSKPQLTDPKADLAVCDPMVLAEHAAPLLIRGQSGSAGAKIVAFVLRRPALYATAPLWLAKWLVNYQQTNTPGDEPPPPLSCFAHYEASKVDVRAKSLVSRTRGRQVSVPPILTYENCTATRIVSWFISGRPPLWAPESGEPFDQLPITDVHKLINNNAPAPTDIASPKFSGMSEQDQLKTVIAESKLIVVCDPLYELRGDLSKREHGVDAVPFSFARSEVVPDFPFTSVIAGDHALKDAAKRRILRAFLKNLNKAMTASRGKTRVVDQHCVDTIYRVFAGIQRESDKKPEPSTPAHFKTFCMQFFSPHRQYDSYGEPKLMMPDNPAPDSSVPWIEKGWNFSWYDLWGLNQLYPDVDPAYVLRECSTIRLARIPSIAWVSAWLRWWWWTVRRESAKASTLVIGFFAALFLALIVAFAQSAFFDSVLRNITFYASNIVDSTETDLPMQLRAPSPDSPPFPQVASSEETNSTNYDPTDSTIGNSANSESNTIAEVTHSAAKREHPLGRLMNSDTVLTVSGLAVWLGWCMPASRWWNDYRRSHGSVSHLRAVRLAVTFLLR